MINPTMEHLSAAKHAHRYLGSTHHVKHHVGGHNSYEDEKAYAAEIYSDADFANCVDTTKSLLDLC
jgi:hypothetical protein